MFFQISNYFEDERIFSLLDCPELQERFLSHKSKVDVLTDG